MFKLVVFVLDDGTEQVVASVLNPHRAKYAVTHQNGVVVLEGTDLVALNAACDILNGFVAQLRFHCTTLFGRELAVEVGTRLHARKPAPRYTHLGYAEAQVPAEA